MNARLIPILLAALCLPACSKEGAASSVTDKTVGLADDHGAMVSLGSVKLGEFDVQVAHAGTVEAGKVLAVDVSFAKGKALPTVRAWVGIESGVGSMKAKLAKEGEDKLHGHVAVPKPMPEGAKLWLELEGATPVLASIALKK